MRLLFVSATRIGDALLTTGLLAHLIDRHPGAQVTVACGPAAAGLFATVPGLEELILLTKGRFARHWLHLWRRTVGRRWDMVVDLRGSSLAWCLLAKERRRWRSGWPGSRIAQLARVLDLEKPASPRVWTRPEHEAAARRLIPDGLPVLALGPTANFTGKQWPAGRFAELAGALTGPGGPLARAHIAVFAAPHERGQAQRLLDMLPSDRLIDALDAGDLLTVYAALRRCRLYVGNDSGLMHLAAASGVPTLGLFGPSSPALYAPWGTRTAVVSTDVPFPQHWLMIKEDPGFLGHMMDSLPVERAAAAATQLLARAAAGVEA
jgi:ADP-heptose:LPS heptosyltransferase